MTSPKDKTKNLDLDALDIPLEDPRWADGVRSRLLARAAELRAQQAGADALVDDDFELTPARPIRAEYLAMDRDALIATFELLDRRIGPVQVAHRKLHELSDNDLRRLIETITPEPE